MDKSTILITLMTLVSWGVGTFIGKLATNRIGERAAFFDILGYAPAIIIFCLFFFKAKDIMQSDAVGAWLAVLAGVIGSLGFIGFYMLLSRKDASSAIPLTALYPMLGAILAFIFLKEQVTVAKVVGIILSGVALYLLSI